MRTKAKKAILLLLSWPVLMQGQYQPQSVYLTNPNNAIGYVKDCAGFWSGAKDNTYGGYFTNISRTGTPTGTGKTVLIQSRDAYAMSRAFMLTGDTSYLANGRSALNFMYTYAWDKTNTGWNTDFNQNGTLTTNSYNNQKWSFMQHYAMVGIEAMAEATNNVRDVRTTANGGAKNDGTDWDWLMKGFNSLNDKMWDNRPGYEGYYETTNKDWSGATGKSFTATVDGTTTNALYLYLLTKDQFFKNRLLTQADNIVSHLYPTLTTTAFGFPEQYDINWKIDNSQTGNDVGHVLKAAWCLCRAYLVQPNANYITAAKGLINEVLTNGGYDKTVGLEAPYSGINWQTGRRTDNSKGWWQLEQAYTSGIMCWYITHDDTFLKMADQALSFYMKYFVDATYKEVYTSTSDNGAVKDATKGSYWKGGYHSTELGYYIYLYGNLFYKNQAVTLYYKFAPKTQAYSISLYPLAIEDAKLKIQGVKLNGADFTTFNADTRTLNIPANTGGVFAVTYYNTNINTNIAVTGITLDQTTATINAGTTKQLLATIAPANATNQSVTWSSGNTAVATVTAYGVVTGIGAGTTTITVTTQDQNKAATATITVLPVAVTGVSISPAAANVNIGGTTQLLATVLPTNASNQIVTWASSNSSVASVNANGQVTGVALGTTTITVTTQDQQKTASCVITVNAVTISRIEAEDMQLFGYTVENNANASNGKQIYTRRSGTAYYTFTGTTGIYNIAVRYLDEPNYNANFQLYANGISDSWNANQTGTASVFVTHTTSNISLDPNTDIQIQGRANGTEYARIDYIEIIPVSAKSEAEPLAINTAESLSLLIFPNPATDIVSVITGEQSSNPLNYTIVNSNGAVCATGKLLNNNTINVSALDRGVYFISISNNGINKVAKLIK